MPDRKLRVFLCHSSTGKPIVRELTSGSSPKAGLDPMRSIHEFQPRINERGFADSRIRGLFVDGTFRQ